MIGGVTANLDGIGLLQGLEARERRELAARCSWRRFRAGERILSRDAESREVLFIVAGEVRVVNYTASGREIAFAILGPGSHVGELSAIDGEPRSASVEGWSMGVVASLDSGPFQELLLQHPAMALELLKRLAQIIRRSDERIAELSILGAMPRVYRELRRLARAEEGRAVIDRLPTQEALAAQVGTTRETVARALGQLAKAGVARRRGRELVIRDLALLAALSEAEA